MLFWAGTAFGILIATAVWVALWNSEPRQTEQLASLEALILRQRGVDIDRAALEAMVELAAEYDPGPEPFP